MLKTTTLRTTALRASVPVILAFACGVALPTTAAAYPGELVHDGPYLNRELCQIGHDNAWPLRAVSECREGNFDNKGYGWYFDYIQPLGA